MPALPPLLNVEDPAETMRRAAKLMRERAADAEKEGYGSDHPGQPWCPDWTYSVVRHVNRNMDTECTAHPWNGEHEGDCNTWGRYAGSHIAAMHPGVALALADWLDNEAVNAPGPGEVYLRGGHTAYALAVAGAYLGEG